MIARLILLILPFALGACAQEDIAATGRDARQYNPITRQYEWPGQRPGP